MNSINRKNQFGLAIAMFALFLVVLSLFFLGSLKKSNNERPIALSEERINDIDHEVYEGEYEEEDEMDKAIEQEFRLTKDPATNAVPVDRLIPANETRNQILAAMQSNRINGAVTGVSWTERGPNNVGGRTRALLYDLNDVGNGFKKVWAGGVGGGLWSTTDITAATPTWTKVDDLLPNLAITSLAQDATNPLNLYAGTGEGWFNADAIQGLGIWKSSNGGTNWAQLGSTNNGNFSFVQKVIAYTSGGTNYVLACTRNASNTLGGIMRSTDAGASWARVLANGVGGAITSRAADIELAADGNLYCSMGIFNTDGIYRSTDNGATWTKIYTAAAEYRIELACAPSNADKVYALVSNNAGNPVLSKIMVTTNATAVTPTWTNVTNPTWCDQGTARPEITRGQAWYDLIAMVDGTDQNTVYIGGVDLMKTTDGGTNWTQITQWAAGCGAIPNIHADNHALVFKPGSNTEFLAGNDGGIYRTINSATSFTQRNTSYNVTQFYGCAAHPTNTNYFLAGAQDNGSQKFTAAGLNNTTVASGGDGGFPHIDQDNANFQITSFTGNQYTISTNGGASFSQALFGGGYFINPTDFDDACNKLYGGNGTGTYFRWNNPETPGANSTVVAVGAFGAQDVTHVMVSPLTPNRVYFGLGNGSVVRVDNANVGTYKTGTTIKTGVGSVSSIAIDPANEDHMLVTYSNYGVTSIFESNNATQASPTWASVEGNLPDMPVRWAVFDPRNSDWAIIATELGVWSTDDLNSGGTTDWQPTNTGLANVRVDMLQYRSGDRTLVAATHGRGLYTAVIPNVVTPDINFAFGQNTGAEQNSASTSCRRYRDYTVDMTIANAPVGDAIVSLNVQGSSTATQGVDFDFTTNGNFAAPSTSATFTSGAATNKTVTIRVYDDAEVEPSEIFTLVYSISGATNAVAGKSFQKYSFGIDDNDVAPLTPYSGNFFVGPSNATANVQTPFRSNLQKFRIQSLFYAAELNAAGVPLAGNITSMNLRITTKNSTQPYSGFTISMANTTSTNLSTGFIAPAFTQVFNGNYSSVVGDNTFTFSAPFAWDGVSNVIVQFCFDNAPAAADAQADVTEVTAAPFGTGVRASTYSNSVAGAGCSLPAAFVTDARVAATFGISSTATTPIETVLNSNKTEYIASNGTFNFYNGANIMNSLTGVSANLGCVTSNLFEAGNTWQPFLGGFRSQKVFDIAPTTNPTATYTVNLYFTAAELATYTGMPGSLQIAKTTAATMAAANSGNTVKANSTTFTPYGTGFIFTASFNGFSKFFLIDAGVTLPITLLSFDGHLDKKSILLDWSTSQELNSKHFEIEKSTDGVNFRYLDKVAAAGSSISQRNYNYVDNKVNEYNYYRLKMVDIDGKFVYSKTILIQNPNASQDVWVMNNPFKSYIDVRFVKTPTGPVKFELLNMAGARVYYKEIGAGDQLRLDLSAVQLSVGTYILKTTVDKKQFVTRVMRE